MSKYQEARMKEKKKENLIKKLAEIDQKLYEAYYSLFCNDYFLMPPFEREEKAEEYLKENFKELSHTLETLIKENLLPPQPYYNFMREMLEYVILDKELPEIYRGYSSIAQFIALLKKALNK